MSFKIGLQRPFSLQIGPSLSVIRIIRAPRLLHSLMLDSIRLRVESVGAIAITGDPSEMSAIGPCFNSPRN